MAPLASKFPRLSSASQVVQGGLNIYRRFCLLNFPASAPADKWPGRCHGYRARRNIENRIKALHHGLELDRARRSAGRMPDCGRPPVAELSRRAHIVLDTPSTTHRLPALSPPYSDIMPILRLTCAHDPDTPFRHAFCRLEVLLVDGARCRGRAIAHALIRNAPSHPHKP